MMRRLAPRRGEEGAVALIVAVLVVAFFTIAASTIDFGQAYVTKRQLSTSADAAALAAAQYYATLPGTCVQLSASSTYATNAQNVANSYMGKNFPGATPGTVSARCAPDGSLWVSFSNSATDAATFGQFAGVNSITTNRAATADVSVPPGTGGVIPYPICLSQAAALGISGTPTPAVLEIDYPSDCDSDPAGNWYTLDCPEDAGNSAANDVAKICTTAITAIKGTPPNPPTLAEAQAACHYTPSPPTPYSADPGCLRGNTGNPSNGNTQNCSNNGTTSDMCFWESLLGQPVVLPVFYDNSYTGSGSNSHWPVIGFVAATICGFHWGNSPGKQGQDTSAPCSTPLSVTAPGPTGNYMLITQSKFFYGGTEGNSGCPLGDPTCDWGTRSAALVR